MKKTFPAGRSLAVAVLLVALLGGCRGKKQSDNGAVTIAIEGDIDTFNPLFTEEIISGEINDLLFPHLVNPQFDTAQGLVIYTPALASSWEFSPDHRDIVFHLRRDALWSDQVPVVARDVQFSFELYGDTAVASVRQSVAHNLRRTNGRLDIARSVEAPDDSTVIFHFDKPSPSQLFDIGVPIIPFHVFGKIPRNELRTQPFNTSPITCGPFVLNRWTPMQEVVLARNERAFGSTVPKLARLVFKVLPDYRSRVQQLQAGEIDLTTNLRVEDAEMLARNPALSIVSTVGRDYDFIGWNNLDPVAYVKSAGKNIEPHKLFGSKNVRRALTMAINRREIVNAYLGKHGREAIGSVSPLFKWAYNDTLKPLPFDPAQASAVLAREGWVDSNGDGILDKAGKKFSFVLKLASGNQLRDVIAAVIQQQLKAIKIEMTIEQVERGTFWNDLMQRKYDAWFAGFSVPLQMQLDDLWNSDLKKHPFNLTGFRNARVDEILAQAGQLSRESDGGNLWREFQVLLHDEQPCTFLFWINNVAGVNKRVHGTQIGVLGTTHGAWEWSVDDEAVTSR